MGVDADSDVAMAGLGHAGDCGGVTLSGRQDYPPATPFGQTVRSLKVYLQAGEGPWLKVGEVSEPATSISRRIRDRGAVSTEEAWRNQETGETIYRHIITVGAQVLHETFRGFSRRGL